MLTAKNSIVDLSVTDPVWIRTAQQWDAACHPVRAELAEWMTVLGPASARELARALTRSPELVHHHLRIMLDAGLVQVHSVRKLVRHAERLYSLTGLVWRFDFETHPLVARRGIVKLQRTWSRASGRLLAKRVARGQVVDANFGRLIHCASETGALSPEGLALLKHHLTAINHLFAEARRAGPPPADAEVLHFNYSFFPLARGTGGAQTPRAAAHKAARTTTPQPRTKPARTTPKRRPAPTGDR